MKEVKSALFSKYILDGVQLDLTPSRMLEELLSVNADRHSLPRSPECPLKPIVDESIDPTLSPLGLDESLFMQYLEKMKLPQGRPWPHAFSSQFTRGRVEKALLDAIWRRGHFTLDELVIKADWHWKCSPLGNMASFYSSVQALCECADSLGIGLEAYSFKESRTNSFLGLKVGTTSSKPSDFEDDPFAPEDSESPSGDVPSILRGRKCPGTANEDSSQWVLYIPFENCDYRLGGSLFSQATGIKGDVAPELDDPDYFIDCYEVVRELVEDGIVTAGRTVADGGLLHALDAFLGPKLSLECDLSDIGRNCGEESLCRLLFSEIPGVVLQIRNLDYDYLDAELILQDVAYYTLGHVSRSPGGIKVQMGGQSLISGILDALLRSDTSEGED